MTGSGGEASGGGRPVVFIHGLWIHPTSWQPWMDAFHEHGYRPSAPAWPGVPDTVDEAREADSIADRGIDEVTEHYQQIIDGLDEPPVLVGHSFGGLIAQKLLGEGHGAAAVAIDAAQIKGVLPVPLSTLRAALPVFRNPANKRKAVALTGDQFRYAFGNAISAEESDRLYDEWAIPAPGRPLFEAATANFTPRAPSEVATGNTGRGPLLLVAGGQDHTVPESVTESTLKQYRHSGAITDFKEFPDRGHSLTIDSGWRDVADESLAWLAKQGLD